MRKIQLTLIFTVFGLLGATTNAQSRWQDYFNYAEVKEIHQINQKIYALSSNAIFTYDLESNEIEKLSKVNLLNGVQPTSAVFNPDLDKFIIGYQNGELDILGEKSENFIEIPLDNYTGSKQINHLSSQDSIMVIAAEYGISIFDLNRREFAETTFFRQNNDYISVHESEIFDNKIFAATENGIYFHELNELIPNFNRWEVTNTNQAFSHIQKFNNELVAASQNQLFLWDGTSFQVIHNLENITDLNLNKGYLTITGNRSIFILDENLSIIVQKTFDATLQSGIYTQNIIFAGTEKQGIINGNSGESIYPDGPFSNKAFGVAAQDGTIWIAPGGINNFYSPQFNSDGISHFDGTQWIHIPNQNLNGARDFYAITLDPNQPETVYATPWDWNHGIFEITNLQQIKEINHTNSSILKNPKPVVNLNTFMQLSAPAINEKGNAFIAQTYIGPDRAGYNGIHKKTTDGNWQYFGLEAYSEGLPGFLSLAVDNQDWAFIGSARGSGVVVTNLNESYNILAGESVGDLPSNNVYALAIDQKETLWIGTQLGLRIKGNPINELQSGNPKTDVVVIEQNGIPEAFLTDTTINDIVVDSSNRKWIATQGAGVFYISENGTEQIFHFTEDQSPLPSNNVSRIAVDSQTGTVYFATENGLVSYQGDAVDSGTGFGEIVAYPNPVRPGYQGNVTIKGLAKNADVRITDVVGNLIYRAKESGGIVQWNQNNLKGKKVASGIYLVMMISGDGLEKATTKIAIVR